MSSSPRKIITKVLFHLDSVWYSFSAKLKNKEKKETIESEYDDESDDENMPVIPEGYLFYMESSAAILACKDRYELRRLL